MNNKNKITKEKLPEAISQALKEECKKRNTIYSYFSPDIELYSNLSNGQFYTFPYEYSREKCSIEESGYKGFNIFKLVEKTKSFIIEIRKLSTLNTYSVKCQENELIIFEFDMPDKALQKMYIIALLHSTYEKLSCTINKTEIEQGGYINYSGNAFYKDKARHYRRPGLIEFDRISFTIGDKNNTNLTGFSRDFSYRMADFTRDILSTITNIESIYKVLNLKVAIEPGECGKSGNYQDYDLILYYRDHKN